MRRGGGTECVSLPGLVSPVTLLDLCMLINIHKLSDTLFIETKVYVFSFFTWADLSNECPTLLRSGLCDFSCVRGDADHIWTFDQDPSNTTVRKASMHMVRSQLMSSQLSGKEWTSLLVPNPLISPIVFSFCGDKLYHQILVLFRLNFTFISEINNSYF